VEVKDGTVIGLDAADDRRRFYVTKKGVILVTRQMLEAS
jgi:hypothetical protein